jgi:hypothetical protein
MEVVQGDAPRRRESQGRGGAQQGKRSGGDAQAKLEQTSSRL